MQNALKRIYLPAIAILAVVSIVFVFLDFGNVISLNAEPWYLADHIILLIFMVDYIVRFIRSENKKKFFVENIFDLIAILPFNDVLSIFRFARLFRIARIAALTKTFRIFRAFGFMGVLKKRAHKFLYTNGFIYVLCTTGILIVCASFAISILEHKSFGDAIWWSIVTTTTVGYGDISPVTTAGRVIAIILMIFGVGLIGMLTGTITTFFVDRAHEKDILDDVSDSGSCEELLHEAKKLNANQYEELVKIARVLNESHDK